jgi:hypothetical protein
MHWRENGSPEMLLSRIGQAAALKEKFERHSDAKKSARSKDQGLTVFGEMVAVLWEQGNQPGALALEMECPVE